MRDISYRYAIFYFLIILFFVATIGYLPSLAYNYKNRDTKANDLLTVAGKADHFKTYAQNYDLIFYGDSRTYIGVSPEKIEKYTGIKTFNYASMAHWFETQYLQLKMLQDHLKDKNIIWIIGDINFLSPSGSDKIHNIVPISFIDAYNYLLLGFTPLDLYQNILLNIFPAYHLLILQDQTQVVFNQTLNRSLNHTHREREIAHCDDINTSFKSSSEFSKDGYLAGCFYYQNDGQLIFVEKDSSYLRERQKSWAKEIDHNREFIPDIKNEKLFEMILDLFKKNGANITVLRYKDAPYNYQENSIRSNSIEEYFLTVKEKVSSYKFSYKEIDFSSFTDSDYFDYNHLNIIGSNKLTKEIVKTIKSDKDAL